MTTKRPRATEAARRLRARTAREQDEMLIDLAVGGLSGGGAFVIADGLDRLLATYNPSSTERPTNKFTSDGAGTLGNVLNIGSRPGLVRAGASIGAVAAPAIGAMYVENPTAKTALSAAAFGASINSFKLLWSNVLMPMLCRKDSTPAELRESLVARLYPSEVAAAINGAKKNADGSERAPQLSASAGGGAGALSGGAEWPTTAQALMARGQIGGPGSDWPTAAQVLGDQYPTAAQVLGEWQPGEASTHGPGPQPAEKDCGCSKATPFLGFIGSSETEEPLYSVGALIMAVGAQGMRADDRRR